MVSRTFFDLDGKDQPEFLHLLFLAGFCILHPSNWIWFVARAVLPAGVVKPCWPLPDYQRLFNGRWHLSNSFHLLLSCGTPVLCAETITATRQLCSTVQLVWRLVLKHTWPVTDSFGPWVPLRTTCPSWGHFNYVDKTLWHWHLAPSWEVCFHIVYFNNYLNSCTSI